MYRFLHARVSFDVDMFAEPSVVVVLSTSTILRISLNWRHHSFLNRSNFCCISRYVLHPTYQVFQTGVCGCLDYDLTQGDDYQTIMGKLSDTDDLIGGFDEDTQRRVVSLLCNSVIGYGEQTQVTTTTIIVAVL